MASSAPPPPQSAALLEALRRDAIAAFQRATAPPSSPHEPGGHRRRPIVAAVDSALHVVLEVLAFGAGGKQLYDDLGIARLVSVDAAAMDAAAVRRQVGLSECAAHWPDHHAVAFVLPPTQAHAQLLARVLEPFVGAGDATAIHCAVLWQPAATSECALEMERQGLAGVVTQRDLALGLLPVGRHVASLCHDGVFAELYVRGQHHALTRITQSVLAIERHGGGAPIRNVTCHGAFAGRVKAMLDTAHRLRPPPPTDKAAPPPPYERLILIDRMEDPLSMLLTPMTYEGLLDALIGMNHGVVYFDKMTGPSDDAAADAATETETERVKILLNHADELFDEIRDVNINTLISRRLGELTQQLVSDARGGSTRTMTATASAPALTIAQVREQLRKVPQLVQKKRSLGHHIALVEQIQRRSQSLALRTYVETEMAILSGALKRGLRVGGVSAGKDVDRALEEAVLRDEPHRLDVFDALKLLCLLSLVSGGLKEERLQWFRRQLCHAYGYHVLPLLAQLEKLELLSTSNKFDYQRRRKELSLMCGVLADDEDAGGTNDNNGGLASSSSSSSLSSAPRDIHFMFPYTGYAPMSVRLVQTSLGMKVKPPRDTGAFFSASSSASLASTSSTGTNQSNGGTGEGDPRRVLVYYVGGVTVAELAALRWLNASQREFEFFVATTAVCNGSRLLRAV